MFMVLTPDVDVYAEDVNDCLAVCMRARGHAVPVGIPRGQAYRFDPACPTDSEFEAYVALAGGYGADERTRMQA